jgi:hypothetical protein
VLFHHFGCRRGVSEHSSTRSEWSIDFDGVMFDSDRARGA